MKFGMICFAFIFSVLQVQAAPLSDRKIIEGYDNCMKFLMLSPAKQAQVAKDSHKPLGLVMSACMTEKRQGLKEVLLLNHEYNDWWRHRHDGGGSGGASWDPQSCGATAQCMGDEQCIGNGGFGTCQSTPAGCDDGPTSCVAGETCSKGVCH